MPEPSKSDVLVQEALRLSDRGVHDPYLNVLPWVEDARTLLPELAHQLEQAELREKAFRYVLVSCPFDLFPKTRRAGDWLRDRARVLNAHRAPEGAESPPVEAEEKRHHPGSTEAERLAAIESVKRAKRV